MSPNTAPTAPSLPSPKTAFSASLPPLVPQHGSWASLSPQTRTCPPRSRGRSSGAGGRWLSLVFACPVPQHQLSVGPVWDLPAPPLHPIPSWWDQALRCPPWAPTTLHRTPRTTTLGQQVPAPAFPMSSNSCLILKIICRQEPPRALLVGHLPKGLQGHTILEQGHQHQPAGQSTPARA